jgi:hypothetical protein
MKIKQTTEIIARGEDGEEFRLRYSNRGEPYREGCEVEAVIAPGVFDPSVSVLLEHPELVQLRDAIIKLLGEDGPKPYRMKHITEVVARGPNGEKFHLRYTNYGEPYREGCDVEVDMSPGSYGRSVSIFLEDSELVRLRESIDKLLGANGRK